MAFRLLSLLLLLCLAATVCHGDEEETTQDSDVIDLTAEQFNDVITSNPVILVEFYAPW